MVKSCCVKNCDIAPDGNVTCFRFPNNRYLKRRWIDAIGLSNKLTANSTVCIKHFHKADYDIVRGRPRLKSKAVPSIFCESDKISVSLPITEEDFKIFRGDTELLNVLRRKLFGEEDEDTTGAELRNCKDTTGPELRNCKDTTSAELRNCSINVEKKVSIGSQDTASVNTEGTTKLENKGRRQLGIKDTTDLKNAGSIEILGEVTVESHSEARVDGNSENDEKLQNSEVQSEGSIDSQNEGSVRIENTSKNEEETVDNSRKTKHNGVLEEKSPVKTYQDAFTESTEKPSSSAEHLNDIEDIIVNYQIKQTRPVHGAETDKAEVEEDGAEVVAVEDDQPVQEKDPVFIEVAVPGDRAGSPRDCLMVLESVQVELDPSTFLAHGEPDDCHETVDLLDDDDDVRPAPTRAPLPASVFASSRRADPISLLTSSDEDDVIIQEPHIDTVEVSDETDEDDVPLVQLLEKPKKKKRKSGVFPQSSYEYFCLDCQFTASSRQEYRAHTAQHSTILQVCEVCHYTTASKSQFSRHKRKHKDDKKFKCHLCDYKAKHNLSLIYHLKTHRALSSVNKGFKCRKCGFKSDVKTVVLKHVKLCTSDVKKYSCDKCVYETKRPSDLRRHRARRHPTELDEDEESAP